MLETIYRFFLVHKLFTSFGKIISPPKLGSELFSLHKSFSYPVYIETLARFWNAHYFGLNNSGHFGEFRGGIRCQATWRSGNPSNPRPSKDPPVVRVISNQKTALLRGGKKKDKSKATRNTSRVGQSSLRSDILLPRPLLGLCRPNHQHHIITLDDDLRPPSLQGHDSAMSWLSPLCRLESWPVSLSALMKLVNSVPLAVLPDVLLVESNYSMVTSDSLLDVVKGRPISNLVIDFIVDLVDASRGRCYLMDALSATELYSSGAWWNSRGDDLVWSDYDAALFPFHENDHWRLAVADLTTSTLYYLDPDEDEAWSATPFIKDWLVEIRAGGRWRQASWHAPQQQTGSADCGIAVVAFMLHISKGDGLPTQGTSFSSTQLSNMRGRLFASLLFASLDPPSSLTAISTGLSDLCVSWGQDLFSKPSSGVAGAQGTGVGMPPDSPTRYPWQSRDEVSTATTAESDSFSLGSLSTRASQPSHSTKPPATSDVSTTTTAANVLFPPGSSPSRGYRHLHPAPSRAHLSWDEALTQITGCEDVQGVSGKEEQPVEVAANSGTTAAAPPPSVTNAADAVSEEERASWTTDSASDISGDEADPEWSDIDWQSPYADDDGPAAARKTLLRFWGAEETSGMTPAAGCPVPPPPWVPTSADGDWVVQHPVNEALGLASAVLEPAVDETDDPGDWSFATIPLAAAMADLRGVGYCRRTVQFLNDRLWPGFKGSDGADGRVWIMSDCPCCGLARDTQDHGILRCPHPTLQALRSSTFASIQVII